MDRALVQRRTLQVLFVTQIISGVGVAVGGSVGALLAAELAGVGISGLALSASVIGGALLALPATAILERHGRRPSLAAGYLAATLGSLLIVIAALRRSVPLLFAGYFLFGGATTANFQARYAAVDLAPASLRGRHLSLIVWATTIGAVVGPSLAAVAGAWLDDYGVPTLAGPYALSALLLGFAALLLAALLRPDPALLARISTPGSSGATPQRAVGMLAALRGVAARPAARLGVLAMATGHLVMIGIMTMTPVHIRSAGHDATHTLRLVGFVLSLHIAGMFAFAPIFGWLTDRLGRRAVILLGLTVLLAACAVSGSAGHRPVPLAGGLMLLGLGWSASMVAGSTLLSESVPVELRAASQGLSDLVMGLAGASAAALSGVIVGAWGYAVLALLAALGTLPLVGNLALSLQRPAPVPVTREGAGLEPGPGPGEV